MKRNTLYNLLLFGPYYRLIHSKYRKPFCLIYGSGSWHRVIKILQPQFERETSFYNLINKEYIMKQAVRVFGWY